MANDRNHGGRRSGDSEAKRIAAGIRPLHLREPEKETAIAALAAGASQDVVAAALGRSQQAISQLASSDGLDLVQYREQRLASARDYQLHRRLQAGNLLAERLIEMAAADELDATALRNLAVVHGILTDKRRLEDGLSTANLAQDIRIWRATSPPDFLPPSIKEAPGDHDAPANEPPATT